MYYDKRWKCVDYEKDNILSDFICINKFEWQGLFFEVNDLEMWIIYVECSNEVNLFTIKSIESIRKITKGD